MEKLKNKKKINIYLKKKQLLYNMIDTILYDRLGVQPNATAEEINKAYKKLAIKLHPDKNKDDANADIKFREINEAKEVLVDEEKRKLYDQLGMEYVNNNCQPPQPDINHNDIFGHMFNMQRMQRQQQQPREDISISAEITLEEIYNEKTIKVKYEQKYVCEKCDGVSSKCSGCNGAGVQIQIIQLNPMMRQQIQRVCGECQGKGTKNVSNCNQCNDGYKIREVTARIPLKNGLSSGEQIHIPKQGHQFKNDKTDLYIKIQITEHSIFKRINENLCINIELKLYQAIYGFEKIIKHLDNRELHISYNGKTEFGTIKKIPNEGMKILKNDSLNNKGDLYIKFTFKLPSIDNIEMSSKLLYLLKILDQEESNNETIIKNSDKNYIKTVILNTTENPFINKETNHQSSDAGPQFQDHPQFMGQQFQGHPQFMGQQFQGHPQFMGQQGGQQCQQM
jgi:DnaJ-class molecular chaperone